MAYNQFNQPVGEQLFDDSAGKPVDLICLTGKYCSVEKLSVKDHLEDLATFYVHDPVEQDWTYLPLSPFDNIEAFKAYLEECETSEDPYYLVIRDNTSQTIIGMFSLLNYYLKNRSLEMGWVVYSRSLQGSRMATEAQYLVMTYVFEELHARRYEWKCDSLNARSKKAANRLGFQYEGTFRQHSIYKGRTRDTSWFSIIDSEWPQLKSRFERWLAPDNFGVDGVQKKSLDQF
ncbi:GNAT family N-acetyltransferase [Streptococcus moroccensis]|uniref:RimJ/RimL family protein N-acetyltransferase n=1 Tax=Streptococcus moroccensis TaxID=1451356 RepID=A0ABT9YUV0_9STRE|nr:GNAT family protein [Streptococcus moroccensis]MDQ0223504.1 RimJ/RimL family protein N-acetyltransferase [Streptococcus moroccensis]